MLNVYNLMLKKTAEPRYENMKACNNIAVGKNVECESLPVHVRKHAPVLSYLLGSRVTPVPQSRQKSPEQKASLLSKLVYGWIQPVLSTGYNRVLEKEDIWTCPDEQQTSLRMERVNLACARFKAKGKSYPDFWAIFWTLKWWFAVQAIIETVAYCLPVVTSVLSRLLIDEVSNLYDGNRRSHGRAVGLLIGYLLTEVIQLHAELGAQYMNVIRGEAVRSLLISKGQQKIFCLGPSGRRQFPPPKITSLLSTDTLRIRTASASICRFVSVIPLLAATIGVLMFNLGLAGLVGLALFVVILVSTMAMGPLSAWLRKKSLPHADERIEVVQEAVTNSRIIKLYAWENPFSQMVSRARRAETLWLQKLNIANSGLIVLGNSSPAFSGMLAFCARILFGHQLSPERAFPSLTLFEMLTPISVILTLGITRVSDGWNSLKRLNELFEAQEVSSTFGDPPEGLSVRLKGASFEWNYDSQNVSSTKVEGKLSEKDESQQPGASNFAGIKSVDLEILKGNLVIVVGTVGSGKSTFLNALAGKVHLTRGLAEVSNSLVANLSDWSMSGTVKENITFGRPFDAERYLSVIRACCLDDDLSQMKDGDYSEVGERGMTLSGGQRARIALARCVYGSSSIVLLDDPLSAVDARIGNTIFERCIRDFLSGSTRIISTHNWQLLSDADQIVWLDGYGGVHSGCLEELMKIPAFVSEYYSSKNASDSLSTRSGNSGTHGVHVETPLDQHPQDSDIIDAELNSIETSEVDHESIFEDRNVEQNEPEAFQDEKSRLFSEENRAKGVVRSKVLFDYFLGDSVQTKVLMIFSIGILILSTGASGMINVTLEFWTGNRFKLSQGIYAAIYCSTVALQALSYWLAQSIICYLCLGLSSSLFDRAIRGVFHAPMVWYDSNPVGRIVTRFTDDLANLDTTFTQALRAALSILLSLIAQAVVTFVYMPWAALVLPPILLIVFVLLSYYRPTTRELNRLSQVFRSTAFTTLTESISGLDAITIFGQCSTWHHCLNEKLDDMNYSYLMNFATHYWMALRVNLCGLLITLVAFFLCVYRAFPLTPSAVGLLMSSIPGMVSQFANICPLLAVLENEINSVERLHELAYEIPQEQTLEDGSGWRPQQGWPTQGSIRFFESSLRYRPGLPCAMKRFNLEVSGGAKIGICGRSGAGKSTIINALFRTVDLCSGTIEIDGVNIASMSLEHLRNALSIIPQDPVLFKGTIRSNLDPFRKHSDIELWEALRRSGVIEINVQSEGLVVDKNHKFHLDMSVENGGCNFSLGERQLLTLARALLRQSKILLLDEATSSLDISADQRVQKTITREFSHCTVLCIAHRLQTIIGYDKVIVLEAGHILEMGPPFQLFSSPNTVFRALCQEARLTATDFFVRSVQPSS